MFSRLLTIIAEQLHSRTAFCRIPIIAEHLSMTSFASQIFVFCLLNHLIQKFCFSRRGSGGATRKISIGTTPRGEEGSKKNLSRRGGCVKGMEVFGGRLSPQRNYGSKIMLRYQPNFMPLVSFYTT